MAAHLPSQLLPPKPCISISPLKSKTCLLWLQTCSRLYHHLGNVVIREICRYLSLNPMLLLSITPTYIRVFRFDNDTWQLPISLSQSIQWSWMSRMSPVSDDTMFVCGGSIDTPVIPSKHVVWSSAYLVTSSGFVTVLTDMSIAREIHGLIAYDKFAYVCGGNSGDNTLSSCERFDVKALTWQALPDMSTPRSRFYPHEYHGKIYICGGDHEMTIDVLDVTALTMMKVQVNLAGLNSSILFVKDDEMFLIGGNWITVMREKNQGLEIVYQKKQAHTTYDLFESSPLISGSFFYFVSNGNCMKSDILR